MDTNTNRYEETVRPKNAFYPFDRNRNPLSVLIIGNGFDLDLGMHTSYKHYAESKLWPFKDLSQGNLGEYLNSRKFADNWFDLEKELANYAHSVSSDNLSNKELLWFDNDDFKILVNTLKEYLQSEQQNLQKNARDCTAKTILSEFSRKNNYFIHSFADIAVSVPSVSLQSVPF